ncbi:hypothetical protein K474DRAFT_906170 [Panus rudis PR-1116 ss-1]|nr:hypothetical protein K474DRAFT_906170 [Panus rudis PR-1116 ss-1]
MILTCIMKSVSSYHHRLRLAVLAREILKINAMFSWIRSSPELTNMVVPDLSLLRIHLEFRTLRSRGIILT